MEYVVEFQVQQEHDGRPEDCSQDEQLVVGDPTWVPAPGDTIDLKYGGKPCFFTVVSRHFHYSGESEIFHVNVVVRHTPLEERMKRISE
jgi:hypothetical protein